MTFYSDHDGPVIAKFEHVTVLLRFQKFIVKD